MSTVIQRANEYLAKELGYPSDTQAIATSILEREDHYNYTDDYTITRDDVITFWTENDNDIFLAGDIAELLLVDECLAKRVMYKALLHAACIMVNNDD